jgi:hypothetical protein
MAEQVVRKPEPIAEYRIKQGFFRIAAGGIFRVEAPGNVKDEEFYAILKAASEAFETAQRYYVFPVGWKCERV